jgi:hypothetical protein
MELVDQGELESRWRLEIAKYRSKTPEEQACDHWRSVRTGMHCGHLIEESAEEGKN